MTAPFQMFAISEVIQTSPDRSSVAPGEVCYDEAHERFWVALSQGRGRFDWRLAHVPNSTFEMRYVTDFWSVLGGSPGWLEYTGGGGTFTQEGPGVGEAAQGVGRTEVPVGVNAYSQMVMGGAQGRTGGGEIRQRWRMKAEAAPDAVNPYFLRFGLSSNTSGITKRSYGIWFECDEVSGDWFCETRDASVSERIDSAAALDDDVEHVFDIVVNAAATQVRFYIDEVLVATNTLNIPQNATGKLGSFTQFYRDPLVGGTASRYADWDLHEVSFDIDGGRMP